ncbi:exo-alpha-sialidase [Kineosporia sp. J2-2]|uniref:exo-alpha-sialidase n=1 Tax=Kineosporia corallincola TaxID=2835133 RepID=A0ABS5TLD1_9ACTN|nr:sialidase family protein [Kineosporia corallincola]MBT0771653.1 exo-alpha-sialidase [Kineosporia corallincola]
MDDLTDRRDDARETAGTTPSETLGDLLALELYAARGVSVTGDDASVDCWHDTREGGLTASATGADGRPHLIPAALGTLAAVRFTTGHLEIPDVPRLNPGDGAFRALVVARNRALETGTLLAKGDAYGIGLERLADNAMGTRFRAGGEEALLTHTETVAENLGAVHLYELHLTGERALAALDGDGSSGITTDDDTYTAPVTTPDPLRVGGTGLGVDLFAVLLIRGEASEEQMDDVRSYLASAYPLGSVPRAVAPAGDEQTGMIAVNTGGRARIPAIVRCDDDSLVLFAEHRWNGDADSGHIGTVARRSTDRGVTWGEQFTVADDGENCLGNPVPVVDRSTGRLHLLLTGNRATDTEAEINAGTSDDTRRVYRTWSDDHGVTWAPVTEITASVKDPAWRWYATGPGGAEQLASGRLLVPCNHWDPAVAAYRCHVILSDDHGETWRTGGIIETDRSNEVQTAQLPDGTVVAHVRVQMDNNPPGFKWWSTSDDEGVSWSPAVRNHSLPSTPVQDDILVLPGGRLVATNHQDFTGRYHLAVNVSTDGGRSWPAYTVIRVGERGNGAAYSDLVHVGGERIAATWEAGREISVGLFDVVYPAHPDRVD